MYLWIIILLSLYVAGHCYLYGRHEWRANENKQGGIAIMCLIPFILVSPFIYYFFD